MSANKIFQFLVPKEKKFFPYFIQAGENMIQASEAFIILLETKDEEEKLLLHQKIKDFENTGDEITHIVFDELSKTFITPFDREDIFKLNSSLDDVVDLINGASQRIRLLHPSGFPAEFHRMAELLYEASRQVLIALTELKNLRNPSKIREACIKINSIELHCDDLYHLVISDLFRNEKDVAELIKKKEIIEMIEDAADRTDSISKLLKSILIKSA